MKKTLIDLGGVLLFYLILIFGVIILNMRFTELNKNVNAGLIVSTYWLKYFFYLKYFWFRKRGLWWKYLQLIKLKLLIHLLMKI